MAHPTSCTAAASYHWHNLSTKDHEGLTFSELMTRAALQGCIWIRWWSAGPLQCPGQHLKQAHLGNQGYAIDLQAFIVCASSPVLPDQNLALGVPSSAKKVLGKFLRLWQLVTGKHSVRLSHMSQQHCEHRAHLREASLQARVTSLLFLCSRCLRLPLCSGLTVRSRLHCAGRNHAPLQSLAQSAFVETGSQHEQDLGCLDL